MISVVFRDVQETFQETTKTFTVDQHAAMELFAIATQTTIKE